MARDYKDYVKAVFRPLVDASGFKQAHLLKTADIDEDRRQEQFKRFKNLKFDRSRASPIANGGFVAIANEGELELLLVCAPSLNEQEVQSFEEFLLEKYDWTSAEFDEATLLLVVKELPGFMKLTNEFRNEASALNILDVIDEHYSGHHLTELKNAYQAVCVFVIGAGNALHGKEISEISLKIAAASPQLRSPILTDSVATAIISLDGAVGCSSFNLEQAVNAAQWRHAFLDIYRCLESLFYFPWINKLRSVTKPETSLLELRDRCRDDLRWNAKEKDSISELFLLASSPEMEEIETTEEFFKEITNDPNAKRDAFGRRVYFARNSLVHHEDREDPDADMPSRQDYQALTLYLCEFLKAFDAKYGRLLSKGLGV